MDYVYVCVYKRTGPACACIYVCMYIPKVRCSAPLLAFFIFDIGRASFLTGDRTPTAARARVYMRACREGRDAIESDIRAPSKNRKKRERETRRAYVLYSFFRNFVVFFYIALVACIGLVYVYVYRGEGLLFWDLISLHARVPACLYFFGILR